MANQVQCPKCGSGLEQTPGGVTPSHCTSCGVRIACPVCATPLTATDDQPDSFQCPTCGSVLSGAETIPNISLAAPPRSTDFETRIRQRPTFELSGFDVHEELGRGGMGVVYRARQFRPNRDVALKVLPPALATHDGSMDRFRHEADVAARIVDSHILPVFEVFEAQGAPVLVLPYIDGTDLRGIIRDRTMIKKGDKLLKPHPWATLSDRDYLDRMLPLLDQLVDAVAVMHAASVLHRDIKPSNIMVDVRGNLWLSDFGLARLADDVHLTVAGARVGTPGYMSPEQEAGDSEVDSRADLFCLGATIYQALTLEMPYGVNGAKLTDPLPTAPSKRQRFVARDFDVVLHKSLEPDRANRYASVVEFRDDWRRVRQGLLPKARRAGWVKRSARAIRRSPWRAAAAVLLLMVGLLGAVAAMPRPVTQTVRITTDPPGARVVMLPLDEGLWDEFDGYPIAVRAIRSRSGHSTPLELSGVAAGTYLVVVDVPGHGFHEAYRTVPPLGQQPPSEQEFPHSRWTVASNGAIELPPIQVPPSSASDGMALFEGGEFTMGSEKLWGPWGACPPHQRTVSSFFLDCREVPMAEFHATMNPRSVPARSNAAITSVTWDDAVAYAEKVGKRLPNEIEYEFAATAGGTRDYPWGDEDKRGEAWEYGPVGEPAWDHTDTNPPVYGLYSNVAEWTSSWYPRYPGQGAIVDHLPQEQLHAVRTVRGGTTGVARRDPVRIAREKQSPWGPRYRPGFNRLTQEPGLGFRCARSTKPPHLE